jgi:predicted nucleotidyltransferase component of viral defense system
MEDRLHPLSLEDLEAWRRRAQVSLDEARKRFAQFVALESIAAEPGLAEVLAFKGGNALRFIYGSPRGTLDLDFTADASFPDEQEHIRQTLDRALRQGGNLFGIKLKCQRVERKPAKKQATLPTYDIAIGYQLPGDRYFADLESPGRQVATVVKVEISFNDVVCETQRRQLTQRHPGEIRVCSLEDIVAEKLRALLQQVIRNRNRPQDVFDIARTMRDHGEALDLVKVAAFLVQKSTARGISVTRTAFSAEEVKTRAAYEYDQVVVDSPADRIPFEEAWAAVLALVGRLAIPEQEGPVMP